ncbi:MAG TPA: AAA family ATPase [Trueperaceae bacterium]
MARGVNLLGRAQVGGHPLLSDKRAALLAHLAYVGEWIGRSQLAGLFWPDIRESEARRNLRQLLLRAQALPYVEGLEVEPERVRWAAESDVKAFRDAVVAGEWATARCVYRGPLLEGLTVRGAGEFEEWLEREREALHRTYRHAVMREARQHSVSGRYAEAVELLERLHAEDELAEDVLQEYLRNLHLLGRRETALAVFEKFRGRLGEELGLAPLEATASLASAIRGGGPPVTVSEGGLRSSETVEQEPPLVGRSRELQAVHQAATPFVLVRGEPGIGKSRLLREALPLAAWRYCREGLQGTPYQPLVTVLREAEGRVDDVLTLLLTGRGAATSDPQIAKVRLMQGLVRFEARASNVGVVYDDLQWADPATLELLLLLVEQGVRVYGTCRRGEESEELLSTLAVLRRRGESSEIELGPLPLEALAELVVGTDSPRALAAAAGGNPMFALELKRAGWTGPGSEEVPRAITEVIDARISRLSTHARRVVQAAAVLGGGFGVESLARVCELPHWDALEAYEEAEQAGVLEEGTFHHDLIRQTVYQGLSAQKRRLLHGRAAAFASEKAEPQEVAEHWYRAGEHERAAEKWLAAAVRLRSRGLHHSAVPTLRRASQLLPAGRLRLNLEVELARLLVEASLLEEASEVIQPLLAATLPPPAKLSLLVSEALRRIYVGGQLDAAAQLLDQAQALEREVADRAQSFRLWRVRTSALYFRGRYQAGLEAAQEALATWQGSEDGEELFFAHYQLALFLDALGRHREALPHHLEALALSRRLEAEHLEVESATSLLVCFRRLGEPERGVAVAEEALAKAGYLASDWLRNNLADAYLALGRAEDAVRLSREIIERGDPNFSAICWARLGEIALLGGGKPEPEFDLALQHLHDCDVPAVQVLALIPLLNHASGAELSRALDAASRVRIGAAPVHVEERFGAALTAARERASRGEGVRQA